MTWNIRPGHRNRTLRLVVVAGAAGVASLATAPPISASVVGTESNPTGSRWTFEPSPNPTGALASGLAAVSCSGPGTCVAVGGASYPPGRQAPSEFLLVEQLSDGRWTVATTPVISGATSSSLSAVSCPVASFCVAVGSVQLASNPSPEPLAETWNGTSWSDTLLPLPSGGTEPSLAGVSCAARGACVAVGYYDHKRSDNSRLLTERLDGSTWSIIPSPVPPHGAGGASEFTAVDCLSTSKCEVVGNVFYNDTLQNVFGYRLSSSTWTYQHQENPGPDPGNIDSAVSCSTVVACTSVGTVAIVGELALAEYWDGATWVRQTVPASTKRPDESLLDDSCVGGSSCVAVGEAYHVKQSNGHLVDARAVGEVWNGATWSLSRPVVPSGMNASLDGISCVSPAICIAVGGASTPSRASTLVEEYTG